MVIHNMVVTTDQQVVLQEQGVGDIIHTNTILTEQLTLIENVLGALYQSADPAIQAEIAVTWQRAQWLADQARMGYASGAASLNLAQELKEQRDALVRDIEQARYYRNPLLRKLTAQIQTDYHDAVWNSLTNRIADALDIEPEDAELIHTLLLSDDEAIFDEDENGYSEAQVIRFRDGLRALVAEVKAMGDDDL